MYLCTGITLHICNDDLYGFVPVPLEDNHDPKSDFEQLLNIKTEAIGRGSPLPLDPFLQDYVTYPELWKFGCNEIYMINLERRTERRELMEMSFKELGMDVKQIKAVDGRYIHILLLYDIYAYLLLYLKLIFANMTWLSLYMPFIRSNNATEYKNWSLHLCSTLYFFNISECHTNLRFSDNWT